jgi:hypothetical protein
LTIGLLPDSGSPGTEVTITVGGVGGCTDSFELDRGRLLVVWGAEDVTSKATVSDGVATIRHSVPNPADPSYTVAARCGSQIATKPFTVVAPPPDPTLALNMAEAERGSEIRATGTDFVCASSIQLNWADDETPITQASPPDFDVPIQIDDAAPLGPRSVVARCQDDPSITDSQSVNIVAAPTTPTTTRTTPTTATTTISTTTTVPTTAPSTTDRVEEEGTTSAEEPPPPGSVWPWLVALVLAVAALLAARHLRHRQEKRQLSRVRVAASTRAPPAAAFHETPAYGEMTYAIRVEARAGTSIPTITEVHHDS